MDSASSLRLWMGRWSCNLHYWALSSIFPAAEKTRPQNTEVSTHCAIRSTSFVRDLSPAFHVFLNLFRAGFFPSGWAQFWRPDGSGWTLGLQMTHSSASVNAAGFLAFSMWYLYKRVQSLQSYESWCWINLRCPRAVQRFCQALASSTVTSVVLADDATKPGVLPDDESQWLTDPFAGASWLVDAWSWVWTALSPLKTGCEPWVNYGWNAGYS